jgi:hypothetical protein
MRKRLSTSSGSTECIADAGADSPASQCAVSGGMFDMLSRDEEKEKAEAMVLTLVAEDAHM